MAARVHDAYLSIAGNPRIMNGVTRKNTSQKLARNWYEVVNIPEKAQKFRSYETIRLIASSNIFVGLQLWKTSYLVFTE